MDHLLLRALRGEAVERPPVWAMRQAGRWDPQFQAVRAGRDFYEFANDPPAAAAASLCPRRFGVDAIILFYDITTLPAAMGLPFSLQPGVGPVPHQPIRTADDVTRLIAEPDPRSFQPVRDLLRLVKAELSGALPVLVFAGSPFTVASYCIGTGKDIAATRRFAEEQPAVWSALLERLETATVRFLSTLVADGADAYQLFDSWAGSLEPAEYERWAQTHHAAILRQVAGVPRILFVKECPYLDRMAEAGAECVSLGRCHDLAAARQRYPDLVFQGNVDEAVLRTGSPDDVRVATLRCIEEGGGRKHVVNLNHGVNKGTPMANFAAFVDAARNVLRDRESVAARPANG